MTAQELRAPFKKGDKVRCVAKDGYEENTFRIGRIFTVAEIHDGYSDYDCLTFVEVNGGPYHWKFELVSEECRCDDAEYNEIIAAQDLIHG